MSQRRIVVRIGPDGNARAETVGIKGEECLGAIALLEDLLDARVASSAFTHEYHETNTRFFDEVDDELRS